MTTPASERQLYQEFLKHGRGQLCLHLATLVLKKAKKVILWNKFCYSFHGLSVIG